jgi:WhiB family transcriptional regulator, redox-sensing transcriptional regulator
VEDDMAQTAPARPGRSRRHYDGSLTIRQPDWDRHARCAGLPTDFFFSEDEDDRLYAKSICRRCPVEADCLAHAIQHRELGGVWGGRTDGERLELIASQARPTELDLGPGEGGDDGAAAA